MVLIMQSIVLALVTCLAFGIVTSHAMAQSDFQPPPIEDCISVRIGATAQAIHLDQMLEDLASADVVFLGETHDDDTTHRVELAVYEAMLARRNSKVALAMEMFERDVQPRLDDYLAGKIDEAAFLATARPWQNYREAYRPLVEAAKSAGAPVIASNFPRPLRTKMMGDPEKALQGLGDDRSLAPAEFLPNSDAYWKRTDNAVRGHLGMMQAMEGNDRRYTTQSLWDNSMGESCALALDKHPGYSVVHVNGGFHTSYWDGTAGQLRQRKPNAKIKTVSILPAASPSSAILRGAPVADYVVLAEERASNLNDDRWSVFVNRKSHYQLHVPASASADHPVPLLIWLGDDGLTSSEGMEYWKTVLGDQAAIVAIEPPFRERQRDLSVGGRWFWSDNFSEDISGMIGAIDRTWGYVLQRYPIDPNRVCLAGEGSGATVVAAATLLTDRMHLNSVAIGPRQYAKIKDFPLPLLEDWGTQQPPARTLRIIGKPGDVAWWRDELKEYESVGLKTAWLDEFSDPWQAASQAEASIRESLRLKGMAEEDARSKRYVVIDSNSPLHWAWGRLAARRVTNVSTHCVAVVSGLAVDHATAIPLSVTSKTAASAEALPKCPGPFGGTTVLVVEPAEVVEWMKVEKNDPVNKASRFHRLRIATIGAGDGGLSNVLKTLLDQTRTNVLIVPAKFYAGEELMRGLEKQASEFSDRMTIQWLPGLGGQQLPIATD